jgi:hypothetical protein
VDLHLPTDSIIMFMRSSGQDLRQLALQALRSTA